MNRLCILFFCCALCLSGGCSDRLSGNDLGIVWVMYDFVATSDDGVPVDVVNAFLSQEGYTPQVIQTYYLTRRSVQRIYLGTDVDPSPLLSGLRKLPGVLLVELDMDTGGFSDDPAAAYFDELIVD